ncbi:arylamine N-acetyltransferase 1 [Mycena rebaudengoi]|nr:arylamine N-acetyltransferase 1 [Mycena rebaudengoi]
MPREPTFATDAFTPSQVAAYLTRIELPASLAASPPSLSQLSAVYLAHHLHVPKDTTCMHVPPAAWNGPSVPIVLGGGYCWANNPTFAALLRSLGFRVSEVAAKVFKNWAPLDPRDTDLRDRWGTITHLVLIVDWPGSGERFVLDVGFGGGGCPIPIPLRDGATLKAEPLPHDPADEPPIDVIPGYTIYRRTPPPPPSSSSPATFACYPAPPDLTTPSIWAHQAHFLLASITIRDIGLYDHYSQAHPLAAFPNFFLVTRLLPGTGGARRSVMFSGAHGSRRGCATRKGPHNRW